MEREEQRRAEGHGEEETPLRGRGTGDVNGFRCQRFETRRCVSLSKHARRKREGGGGGGVQLMEEEEEEFIQNLTRAKRDGARLCAETHLLTTDYLGTAKNYGWRPARGGPWQHCGFFEKSLKTAYSMWQMENSMHTHPASARYKRERERETIEPALGVRNVGLEFCGPNNATRNCESVYGKTGSFLPILLVGRHCCFCAPAQVDLVTREALQDYQRQ